LTGSLALLIPETTQHGTVYHPANRVAVQIAGVVGKRLIPEDRLPYIRALGFEVRLLNGQLLRQHEPVDIEA
jgi:hypothetical protein